MGILKEILDGHVNELRSMTGTQDEVKEKIFLKRGEICSSCPLKQGNICNSNKFINPETLDVSNTAKSGYARGCGCRLSAKQRSPGSKCPAGFWGGEFNQ
jgi:hypothetical protein|tara:strand:- start:45792 stop:46091 length:300 start_codon:yes stop_codon:yes gene_type:complete